MKAGICGFGNYAPQYRIRVSEISKVWGKGKSMDSFQGVVSKSVADSDEDSTTMGFEASREAIGAVKPEKIGAIYFGSESKAYSVKPTAGILAGLLGINPFNFSSDLEFACKAGTSAMQAALAMVEGGLCEYALSVGSDCAQGAPGDVLEYASACGAGAVLIGKKGKVASVVSTLSYSTDTPDFWRAKGEKYPKHSGRFTGGPGYFHHTLTAAREIMKRTGFSPSDFSHVVFHQPNVAFPKKASKALGFSDSQLKAGLFSEEIGNIYSGGALFSLAQVLSIAKKGELILAVSYGSGAGSDAFVIKVEKSGKGPLTREAPIYVDYGNYLRMRGKI